MAVNSQFTVATHILSLLVIHDRPLTSRAISESVNTNPVVVRRITGMLQRAGLVKTNMGADGGTYIEKPAHEITLLDVFQATGQGSLLGMHSRQPNPDCPCGGQIQDVLEPVYGRAQRALEEELARTTIADLALEISPDYAGS